MFQNSNVIFSFDLTNLNVQFIQKNNFNSVSFSLTILSNKYVLYESRKVENFNVWWHQISWNKTTKVKTYHKTTWKFNKIRFSTTENSLWLNFQKMTICKTIDRKVQIDEIEKSFLKCNHCQFIFVHSSSRKQKSNEMKHHLRNFDCIKNQSTEHFSIQEQIDFSKAINCC